MKIIKMLEKMFFEFKGYPQINAFQVVPGAMSPLTEMAVKCSPEALRSPGRVGSIKTHPLTLIAVKTVKLQEKTRGSLV